MSRALTGTRMYEAMVRYVYERGARREENGSGWWWHPELLESDCTLGEAVEQLLDSDGVDPRKALRFEAEIGWVEEDTPMTTGPREARTGAEREQCERCGQDYAIWCAPSDLWNLSIRNGDRANPCEWSFLCPICFMRLAEERVLGTSLWIVRPERDSDFEEFKSSARFPRAAA